MTEGGYITTVNWGIVVLLATALVGSCKLFGPDLVAAHDFAILYCSNNIKIEHVTKLDEETLQNGLLDEHYDRNGDRIADIHALSSITGAMDLESGLVPHREHPIFWQVDLDFNGLIDIIYVDIHGEGRCDDIKPYLDLNAPLLPEMFHGYDPFGPEQLDDEHELPRGGHL